MKRGETVYYGEYIEAKNLLSLDAFEQYLVFERKNPNIT